MSYEQLTTFAIVAMSIIGGLVTIDKLIDLIKKYKKPSDNVNETLRQHTEMLASDNKRIKELEDTVKGSNRIQTRALLQICNHMIDGNHTEKLKSVRDEIEEYLTDN